MRPSELFCFVHTIKHTKEIRLVFEYLLVPDLTSYEEKRLDAGLLARWK